MTIDPLIDRSTPDRASGVESPIVRWSLGTLLAVSVAVGVVARVIYFVRDRPLWYDEAALAVNILERTLTGFLQPLTWAQTAPPLFLALVRLLSDVLGPGERVLRMVSFLSGLGLLPCLFVVAKRIGGYRVAAFATSLASLSPLLASYSSEVKPYETDVLVAALLMLMALRASGSRWRDVWQLALAGVVGILLSTPAIFTLGGVSAFLLLRQPRNERQAAIPVFLGAVWVGAFLLVVLTVHATAASRTNDIGPFLREYWRPYFLEVPLGQVARRAARIYDELVPGLVLATYAPAGSTLLSAFALGGGVIALLRLRKLAELALLTVPLALLAVAARLSLYPMAPRLALFTSVPILILLSIGFWGWSLWPHSRLATAMRVGLTTLAAILAAGAAYFEVARSPRTELSREFMEQVLLDSANATPVWLSYGAGPAWEYYSKVYRPHDARPAGRAEVLHAPSTDALARLPAAERDQRMTEWADSQIGSIRDATPGCARLILSHTSATELQSITDAITRRPGTVLSSTAATGAYLLRVCFN